jgi:hypothetical protein
MATIPETSKQNGLDEWREHFVQAFPEIAALLRDRGTEFHVENSAAGGLVLVIEHRGDRRFGVAMTPTALRGLRGRKYDASDKGKPSERKDFIDELKRRLGTIGASAEEVYNSASFNWKYVKRRRGNPLSKNAY